MAQFKVRTRDKTNPKGKPRVYFTCHFDDFKAYFDKICSDIFATHDVAIYYTEDMREPLDQANIEVDLGEMNLFVVPVSLRLLCDENRAMKTDIAYAKANNIPILPFMMESGIDEIYSHEENFGERQYLTPFIQDSTATRYEDKLKRHLDSILISDEMAKRVRAAFDAYVFLSYRKKDRRFANQLMRIIHSIPECRDIAVWYDEFLTPGESFAENIERAMSQSRLFAMLVTPSLLEEGNYVMREEYPAAKRIGMEILPTEMEKTDFSVLSEKFIGIPTPVHTEDVLFRETLLRTIWNIAKSENNDDPEHNFLIGLAYLDGIDVEIDVERGIGLISSAADKDLPEAMEILFWLYFEGKRVPQNFDKAANMAIRIVDFYTKTYGSEHEKVVEWLHNLGIAYQEMTRFDDALEVQKRVYDIRVKSFGKKHQTTLVALKNLSLTYGHIGQLDKAIKMQARAYNLSCELLGDEHPDTIHAMHLLGHLYVIQGDKSHAEDAFDFTEAAYLLRCEVLGKNHPDTLLSFNNFAMAHNKFGSPDKAIELQEELCVLAEKTLGEDNSATLLYLSNLAVTYQKAKKIRKMTEVLETVCARWQRSGKENHPSALLSTYNLINAYFSRFRIKKAYELCEALYDRQLKLFGEQHRATYDYRRLLQMLCIMRGDLKRWAELQGIKL